MAEIGDRFWVALFPPERMEQARWAFQNRARLDGLVFGPVRRDVDEERRDARPKIRIYVAEVVGFQDTGAVHGAGDFGKGSSNVTP